MNNYNIVHMRQTCSYVNFTIDKYQRKLASRPALGHFLLIENFSTEDGVKVSLIEKLYNTWGDDTKITF